MSALLSAQRIALLTDFGYQDAYAGILKGVISQISTNTAILDITHGIPAGNIRWGAYTLMTALSFFPAQTVVVGVVDPGVGSERAGICIQTEKFYLVGPDNGLFSYVLREHPPLAAYRLENPAYFLDPVSTTFHGRDIFAPVAAHLCQGVPASELGPPLAEPFCFEWPEPQVSASEIRGEVVLYDHFGNLISNISRRQVLDFLAQKASVHQAQPCEIEIASARLGQIEPTYAAVPPKSLVALWGSSDLLEISVNQGDAQAQLGAQVGDQLVLRRPGSVD